MRLVYIFLSSLFILFATFPSTVHAQKVGYLELSQLFNNYPKYRTATEKLEKFKSEQKKQIQSIKENVQKERKQFKKEARMLSKEQRRKKQNKLKGKMRDYQKNIDSIKQKIKQKRQNLITPVLDKIRTAVSEVAKKHGYTAVKTYQSNSQSDIIWVSSSYDITDKVLDNLTNQSGG